MVALEKYLQHVSKTCASLRKRLVLHSHCWPAIFVHSRLCLSSTGAKATHFLKDWSLGLSILKAHFLSSASRTIWRPWARECVYALSASTLEMDTCLGSIKFSFNLALMRQLHVEHQNIWFVYVRLMRLVLITYILSFCIFLIKTLRHYALISAKWLFNLGICRI